MAHFLEKQGFKQQALAVSSDPEHRFELAVQLCDMKVLYIKILIYGSKLFKGKFDIARFDYNYHDAFILDGS